MTSIDRTIYRHVKRSYTTKGLIEAYTPTEEERRAIASNFWNWLYKSRHNKPIFKALLYRRALQKA